MAFSLFLWCQANLFHHQNVKKCTFYSISSIPDCHCQFLQVILDNEALAYHGDKQGTYGLSEVINGKRSWKSVTHAIWYNSDFKDWRIGALSENGTNFRGITSIDNEEYDCPQEVPKQRWQYYFGDDVSKSCSTDVSIQCIGKKEQEQKKSSVPNMEINQDFPT